MARVNGSFFSFSVVAALAAAGVLSAQGPGPQGAAQQPAGPPPFVSPIFGDNMVLQRDKPNPIWGWSQPGDTVRVEIADKSATATAAADGRWQVKIQPPAVGGPYTVKISGKQTVELHEVLVGDIWLCSGQSNMQFGLSGARNGAEEVKNANYPQIRYYVVGEKVSYTPVDVPRGTWRVVSPATVGGRGGGISAAAYFFARRTQESTHVPIGLIQAAVGGVPAETFVSADGFRPLKEFAPGVAEVERLSKLPGRQYGNFIMHWLDEYDIGTKDGANWADPKMDDSSWKTVTIPGAFQQLGVADVQSLCWFRKVITLPDPLPAGSGQILLGQVEKMDTVYVNGRQVGASSWVENPRAYRAGSLVPGKNVIAIRLYKIKPNGGFLAKPEDLRFTLGSLTIPLAGEWKGKVAVDGHPPQAMPLGPENLDSMPAVLYNGMLAPIVPLAITGAVWYQGESNSERAYQYRSLLPALIADWRKQFGQGDFPFLIASLPAYMHRKDKPGDDSWAELREAQIMAAKNVPHTCVAITVDTGDADNIHPVDKKEVGDRLAFCALAEHYGIKIPYIGPRFSKMENTKGGLKLHFDHTDGGLVVKGDKLGEFAIAGADHKWYWADAHLEGNTITVSSPSVPKPVAVRYAWQSNPLASLFNGAGLPAEPFRTDNWPGETVNHSTYGNDGVHQGEQ